jgi:type IV pilus modification protein PilV
MRQTSERSTIKIKSNDGFTILEVLIALAILGIGILGVAAMQIGAVNGNANARKSTELANLATAQVEALMHEPYDTIAGGNRNQGPYNIQWAVSGPDVPIDNTRTVTVTASWNNGQRPLTLVYYIADTF